MSLPGREAAGPLRRLTVRDVPLLREALRRQPHLLAGFSCLGILLWRHLFEMRWTRIGGALCLFYDTREAGGRFMPVPPLGPYGAATLSACATLMEAVNGVRPVSRVESLAAEDLETFRRLGWRIYEKGPEYVVRRTDAAFLRGQRLKHRRNLYNRFVRDTAAPRLRPYANRDRRQVLALIGRWAAQRRAAYTDPVYRRLLEDNRSALERLLVSPPDPRVVLRVTQAAGEIVAFTAGDLISPDVFCVHFEVVERRYPGAAQFTFTELARTLTCRFINVMDDSGLANLRKSKLLMKPVLTPMSYCASPVP
ncbi:MAG: phosphatidylglycerol lysyltransferase domain-containing protein [Deltaproteobacteria bacterium]